MALLNLNKLNNIVPANVLGQINDDFIQKFQCNTGLRLCHFLSQAAHESGNFQYIRENLFYSAQGLLRVFPSYFNVATASQYANQPEKIANLVYANRNGNGDVNSGDGFNFRGRGYIQTTGKRNYIRFGQFLGMEDEIVNNPDLLATTYPLSSAAFYFSDNNLWVLCGMGATSDTVTLITKRVNGGINGLPERLAYFNKYWAAYNA